MSAEQPHSLPRQELRVVKGDNFKDDPWDYRYESGKSLYADPRTGEQREASHFRHARAGDEVRYDTKRIEDAHDKEQLAGQALVYDVGEKTLRAVGVEEPFFRERQESFQLLDRMIQRLNGDFTVNEPFTQAYVGRHNGAVESNWEAIMAGKKVDRQGKESDWVVVAQFNKRGVLVALKDVPLAIHEELQERFGEKKPVASALEEQEERGVEEGLTDSELGNMVKTLGVMQKTLDGFENGLKSRTSEVFTKISSENAVDTGMGTLAELRHQINALIDAGDPRLQALQGEIKGVDQKIAAVDNDYTALKGMVTRGVVPRLHEISQLKEESWVGMQQRVNTMKEGLQEAQSRLQELMKRLEEPEAAAEEPVVEHAGASPEEATPVRRSAAAEAVRADLAAPREETASEPGSNIVESVAAGVAVALPRLENDSVLTEQQRRNYDKAVATIQTVLGENRKGGGSLGEKLRALGSTPEEIVRNLRMPGEMRDAVLADLRMRTQHLYHQFEPEGKKVFLAGVREERSKPINPSDAENGEMQVDSLDNVAILALKMLDGTFRTEDDVVKNKVNGGNHRHAAERVLKDFAGSQVVDKAETYSENETMKKIFKAISSGMTEASQQLNDHVLFPLNHLREAFKSERRVDEDRLYSQTLNIESKRQEVVYQLNQLSRNVDNLFREAKAEDLPKDEREKAQAAANDVRAMRSIIETAGYNTQENFWQGLLNAARSSAADDGLTQKFYVQIHTYELDKVMYKDFQRALTFAEKYAQS